MRTSRSVVAGAGAGLSLILAGSVSLAAVGAVVSFNGWPVAEVPSPRAIALSEARAGDADAPPFVAAEPRPALVVGAPAARVPRRVRLTRPSVAPRARRRAPAAGSRRPPTTGRTGGVTRRRPAPAPAVAARRPAPAPPAAPSASPVVRDTQAGAEALLEPLAPVAPQATGTVGTSLEQTAAGVTQATERLGDAATGGRSQAPPAPAQAVQPLVQVPLPVAPLP